MFSLVFLSLLCTSFLRSARLKFNVDYCMQSTFHTIECGASAASKFPLWHSNWESVASHCNIVLVLARIVFLPLDRSQRTGASPRFEGIYKKKAYQLKFTGKLDMCYPFGLQGFELVANWIEAMMNRMSVLPPLLIVATGTSVITTLLGYPISYDRFWLLRKWLHQLKKISKGTKRWSGKRQKIGLCAFSCVPLAKSARIILSKNHICMPSVDVCLCIIQPSVERLPPNKSIIPSLGKSDPVSMAKCTVATSFQSFRRYCTNSPHYPCFNIFFKL